MVDHLVLFAVKEDAPAEDVEELLSSIRDLRGNVSNILDISVGENFSERGGPYTHGLYVRFQTADDLHAYIEHPEHKKVVEKLNAATSERVVVDYDHER